jgi:hypothetical protein
VLALLCESKGNKKIVTCPEKLIINWPKSRKQEKEELVIEIPKDGTLTIDKIASLAKVSVEHVKPIEKELKK